MGKDRTEKTKRQNAVRHNPLLRDIEEDQAPKPIKNKVKAKKVLKEKKEAEESEFLPDRLSAKLLRQVHEQQEEEEAISRAKPQRAELQARLAEEHDVGVEDEDDDDQVVEDGEDITEFTENFELDPEDERALEMFMFGSKNNQARTLGDIVMDKIKQNERRADMDPSTAEAIVRSRLNPKVVDVYTQYVLEASIHPELAALHETDDYRIAELLKRYTSGALPKAFKIIPALSNWEEILFLTKPEEWSPPAVRMATKIFASNLNVNMAQRYYNLVLLPRVRDNISQYKKLNWHLYMALKKSLFKAAAFYKGILFPLCESGDCTLREATIVGSLLKKVSIPPVHSAVALLKLAQMPYTGANSMFIRILLDKKYALPWEVVDALAKHFCSFKNETRQLPVLWHHALLVFAQRYKTDVSEEHKEQLKLLLRHQNHAQITPEIRRELFSTPSRGGAFNYNQANDEEMAD